MTGTMDSTGASDSVHVPAGCLCSIVADFTTGSFVGTIALQAKATAAGSWITIESYTADAFKVWQDAAPRDLRLNCTTATSATAAVELTVGPQI